MTRPPFELQGRVEAVLIGMKHGSSASEEVKKIQAIRGHGIKGDRHAGTRLADVREKELLSFGFLKGVEIANYREFSAVSVEEIDEISRAMPSSVAGTHIIEIARGALGENLVISGIPKLTELPARTMLFFRKPEGQPRTAVLTVWGENTPCLAPGEVIQRLNPHTPGLAAVFPKAAGGKRGVVGVVYMSGVIHAGDDVIVKVPRQRIYEP